MGTVHKLFPQDAEHQPVIEQAPIVRFYTVVAGSKPQIQDCETGAVLSDQQAKAQMSLLKLAARAAIDLEDTHRVIDYLARIVDLRNAMVVMPDNFLL